MSRWDNHILPHGPLEQLDGRLWQVTGTLRGMPLPRNMVVYRLNSGGLLIHSAIALDAARMAELDALGPVEVIVVPSGYHRIDAGVYHARYPKAKVVCPAKTWGRVSQAVAVHGTCEDYLPTIGVRAHVPMGTRGLECALDLDLADGHGVALVMCDLLFNVKSHFAGVAGFVLRYVTQSTGFVGTTRIARLFLVKDMKSWQMWLEAQAARRDLRLVCMAHGDVVREPMKALTSAAERLPV